MNQKHFNELGTLSLLRNSDEENNDEDDNTCNYSYSELNATRTIIVIILVLGIVYLLYKKDNIDKGNLLINYDNLKDTNDKSKLSQKNKTSLEPSESKETQKP